MTDFSCAGGAGHGYELVGFEIVGVDIVDQPHYPGRFIKADFLALPISFLRTFTLIHCSPPCQAHSAMRVLHNAKRHEDLIGPTREKLIASGVDFVIENVPGAPLINPITLCGSMFDHLKTPCGAELRRHRLFECSFPVVAPKCQHRRGVPTIGVYGSHYRNRSRPSGTNHQPKTDFSQADARIAMGVDWTVTGDELSQMIPPAFTRFIGSQFTRFAVRGEHAPAASRRET